MREGRTLRILTIGLISLLFILLIVSLATGGTKIPFLYNLRVSYYGLLYQITKPQNDPEKFKELHQATSAKIEQRNIALVKSARCIACHGTMVELGKEEHEEEERMKYPIHQMMLTSPILDFQCTDCHTEVDTRKQNPGRATIKVDRKLCSQFPCHNFLVMGEHGKDKKTAKKWLVNHSRVAMSIGINQCRQCHLPRSELDTCDECHLRGGVRPSSHRAEYNVSISRIYPEIPRAESITTITWQGFHFVFVRETLQKMGVLEVSAYKLPMDKISRLSCGACHVLKDWCTKCHIPHTPNWLLDPVNGHSATVQKYGTVYCFKCHDELGSECVACHTYFGHR